MALRENQGSEGPANRRDRSGKPVGYAGGFSSHKNNRVFVTPALVENRSQEESGSRIDTFKYVDACEMGGGGGPVETDSHEA